MWRDLAPVGRSVASGGYNRSPWASAETELRAWFVAECEARGLVVETDGIGNQVAWWAPEPASGKGVLTGSHLDSVLDGGAYDGPLGVLQHPVDDGGIDRLLGVAADHPATTYDLAELHGATLAPRRPLRDPPCNAGLVLVPPMMHGGGYST